MLFIDGGNQSIDQLKAEGCVETDQRDMLTELETAATTLEHYDYFVEKVVEMARLRKLSHMASDLMEQIDDGISDSRELIMQLKHYIYSMPQSRVQGVFSSLETLVQDMEHTCKSSVLGNIHRAFDEVVYKLQPGDLVLVMGEAHIGKSALVLEWCLRTALDCDTGVALFTPAIDGQQVTCRFLAMLAEVDLYGLRAGLLSATDYSTLAQRKEQLAQMPIYINDNTMLTDVEVCDAMIRLVAEHKVGLVVVDGLQRVSEIMDGMRHLGERLKQWAVEQQVVLVVVSEQDVGVSEKSLHHEELMQVADEIISIERGDEMTERRIRVLRHRHGPTGLFCRSWIPGVASYDWERPVVDDIRKDEDEDEDIDFP